MISYQSKTAEMLFFWYNGPMLSKSKHTLFGLLYLVMLLLMVHWLYTSVMYLQEISKIAIFIAVFLFLLTWLLRDRLKKAYVWLTQHKKGFLIGAVICQFVMMVCAELFIRRDAAVVFKGAFDLLKQSSITNYLSRNPNNIPLFLYEKFFYVIFGSSGLWVMQLLNILYVNLGAVLLYKLSQKHFSQKTADLAFVFYVSLICYSPYFYSMYTDILPIPLITLQLWWVLDLLKADDAVISWKELLGLGVLSGIAMLIRPTTIIVMIAFWAVLFFRGNWKSFGKIAMVTGLATGFVFAGLNIAVEHQTVVPILKKEGLAKGPLLFINLGLTDMGHNQEDMKEGLLAYIDEDKRSDYNNGLFKKENVIKEIKRRLKEYGPWGLLGHIYYKQSLTVAEGTLGWLYRDVEYEKTPFINPLYAPLTKNNGLAKWVRTYFLSIDRPQYKYYEFVKQVIWIVLSAGLVGAYLKCRDTDAFNFLSLAVFGGLLFLTIFEGGKTRYLIQFLPQIILVASIGLAGFSKKVNTYKLSLV